MYKNFIVKKENGEIEKFDIEKIKKSVGVCTDINGLCDATLSELEKKGKKNISTDDIYKSIGKILKKKNKEAFLRYNLTLAVSKMGPEGFAFEKFIAQVFASYGYRIEVGKKIKGKCGVIHEVDVIAEKENDLITAELKFHNSRSKKTDLKVALYMRARFDDIFKSGYYKKKNPKQFIITNTKFTDNARIYAKCAGIDVFSWNYPEGKNLHDFIMNSDIYPLTALEGLSNKAKKYFISKRIVSCRDLEKNNFKIIYDNNYIPKEDREGVIEEIKNIRKIFTNKIKN